MVTRVPRSRAQGANARRSSSPPPARCSCAAGSTGRRSTRSPRRPGTRKARSTRTSSARTTSTSRCSTRTTTSAWRRTSGCCSTSRPSRTRSARSAASWWRPTRGTRTGCRRWPSSSPTRRGTSPAPGVRARSRAVPRSDRRRHRNGLRAPRPALRVPALEAARASSVLARGYSAERRLDPGAASSEMFVELHAGFIVGSRFQGRGVTHDGRCRHLGRPPAPATLGAKAPRSSGATAGIARSGSSYQRDAFASSSTTRSSVRRTTAPRSARRREADLTELPTLPKRLLMERFDDVVTDPRLRLARSRAVPRGRRLGRALRERVPRVLDLGDVRKCPVCSSTLREEFAHWVAVFVRSFARLGMTPETRIVGIGAPSALHLSQQVIAAMQAGRSGAPRVSVTTPIDGLLGRPRGVPAGGDRRLPERHLAARGGTAPAAVSRSLRASSSRRPRSSRDDAVTRIASAWTAPVQGYFTTEVGVIAAGSLDHVGMHVCEEAIIECRRRPRSGGGSGSLGRQASPLDESP